MCVTPRNKGLPFFPASSPFMSTTAGGVFPVVKPQIPFPSPAPDWTGLRRRSPPPAKTLTLAAPRPWRGARRPSLPTLAGFPHHLPSPFPSLRWRSLNPLSGAGVVSAGRSKKKAGGPSTGRIEGNAEVRRRAKEGARKRSRRMAENLFYRHSKTWGDEADSFTEEELEMIGLGYDRQVRFMEKDDPKLRHPDDWYKYGQYGPYSWRGIVVGSPIRGRFSDERVTIIGEVRDHEEWEQIERFEMASDFSQRLESMDHRLGLQYFWVFVRHPKWRSSDLPWQQWTLVSEVALEAGNQRLDKWSLMGRLGNNSRALITQCAAWMRPDIIYVRRPVYQCRFEPQENFFRLLGPLLDPDTEDQFVCELKVADGKVETCTYFAGLCKIVRINPKAFVDDVVEAYQRLSDEGKSRCLEFLLTNHPMELLHPYTKEWKTRLEEMELGCDAPDGSDGEEEDDGEMVDWIEDDGGDEEGEEDLVIDVEEGEDDEVLGAGGSAGEVSDPEESEEYWNEQWKRAMKDPDAMEGLVKRSIEVSDQVYKNQNPEEERSWGDEQTPEEEEEEEEEEGSRFSPAEGREWRPRRRIKKSRIPPELFLRAAVRPFTYRNLVKEIVLMRHALVEKEITLNQ